MHEVSLVHALFDQADRAIGSRSPEAVRVVRMRIGARAGVETALFLTAFDGTKAERGYRNAELTIIDEPVEWRCDRCAQSSAEEDELLCPACAAPLRLLRGGALVLERIELEVQDV